jgi:hypothetical protein
MPASTGARSWIFIMHHIRVTSYEFIINPSCTRGTRKLSIYMFQSIWATYYNNLHLDEYLTLKRKKEKT